jgi:DNA-binding CsgD family transcriptional regulator
LQFVANMASRTITVIHDPARLAAVRRTNLLDTPPEECFDRLTRLAAVTVGAPAAFLSLVDECSDFYKSNFGFSDPLATTRRLTGETFCHHALVSDGLVIIDDARSDPAYASMPTIRSMGIIAYLGVPLDSVGGQPLGAFCLIDTKPRHWTRDEVTTVCLLARAALREIELRSRNAAPAPAEALTDVPKLSPREREVMLRLVAGQRLKEIAHELALSVKTVATHRQRLLRKLDLPDNRALYRYALREGLLDWSVSTR